MTAKQNIFSILIILLIGSMCTKITFAQTLLYKITTLNKEFNRKTVITRLDNGYLIKTSNSLNKDESTYSTDQSFSILQWNFHSPEKGADISAKRVDNRIFVTGQIKDKPINEKIEIDHLPWYQELGWGLRPHIISNKEPIRFWMLDSNSQQIAKLEAKKEKPETIELNGRKIESLYVKIRLTGIMKLLWSGDMWFRKSDGEFLCSKMKNGPTGPITIIQLINESRL